MHKNVIYSIEIDKVKYIFYENQLTHVIYPEFVQINRDLAKKADDLIREKGLPPQAIVAEFPSFTDISSEARKYWASNAVLEKGISHAGFLRSRTLQFLANAYTMFNKPQIPTKFFYSLEAAFKWSEDQIDEFANKQENKADNNSLIMF